MNYDLIDLLTFNLPLLRILKLINSGYFQRGCCPFCLPI